MWWRRRRALRDLEEELREHLHQETAENISRGMPPEEAGWRARIKFGNPRLAAERTRAVWAWSLAFVPSWLLGYLLVGPSLWPRGLAPLSLLIKSVRFGGQGQFANLIQLLNYRLDAFLILASALVGLLLVARIVDPTILPDVLPRFTR